MTRYASIGDANLGYPNLPDAGAEVARVIDFTVVAEQFRKLLLIGAPVGAVLAPAANHDENKEQDRPRDHPAEVPRLVRFLLVGHLSRAAASRGAAGRASKSASRDRASKPRP